MLNKRAQLSDAMTWIVATLIIIFILVIFIFASETIAKWKSISSLNAIGDENSENTTNIIKMKNSFAFEKNKTNQLKIEVWLNEKK